MTPEPTGRRRHRSERRWGKEYLVLQVEVTGMVTAMPCGYAITEAETWWRDARTSDLTVETENVA